ncbi:hypothetical protein Tco_1203481 [Tanacetum coccineum]
MAIAIPKAVFTPASLETINVLLLPEPLGLDKLPTLSDVDLSRRFSSKRCNTSGDDRGLGYCWIDGTTCGSFNSYEKDFKEFAPETFTWRNYTREIQHKDVVWKSKEEKMMQHAKLCEDSGSWSKGWVVEREEYCAYICEDRIISKAYFMWIICCRGHKFCFPYMGNEPLFTASVEKHVADRSRLNLKRADQFPLCQSSSLHDRHTFWVNMSYNEQSTTRSDKLTEADFDDDASSGFDNDPDAFLFLVSTTMSKP